MWTWITMAGAAISAVVNLWAYVIHSKNKEIYLFAGASAIMFLGVGALSVFYVGAFGVLALTQVDQGTWSKTLIPISAFVFVTVWTAPAILGLIKMRTFLGAKRYFHDS